MNSKMYLTFDLLEDIMDMPDDERIIHLKKAEVFRISPLVEYAYHNYSSISNLSILPENTISTNFLNAIRFPDFASTPNYHSFNSLECEFTRTPQTQDDVDEEKWQAFLMRVQKAAEMPGLGGSFSKSLAATLGEMVDNVITHSQKSETGIVGYRSAENEFEYIVADAGLGILNSLRENSKFNRINDYATALKTAIENGVTRFGDEQHHGTGFNLLRNIAKNNSYLRFRSGNYSLNLDGTKVNDNNVITNEVRPCSYYQGFLISILCKK